MLISETMSYSKLEEVYSIPISVNLCELRQVIYYGTHFHHLKT